MRAWLPIYLRHAVHVKEAHFALGDATDVISGRRINGYRRPELQRRADDLAEARPEAREHALVELVRHQQRDFFDEAHRLADQGIAGDRGVLGDRADGGAEEQLLVLRAAAEGGNQVIEADPERRVARDLAKLSVFVLDALDAAIAAVAAHALFVDAEVVEIERDDRAVAGHRVLAGSDGDDVDRLVVRVAQRLEEQLAQRLARVLDDAVLDVQSRRHCDTRSPRRSTDRKSKRNPMSTSERAVLRRPLGEGRTTLRESPGPLLQAARSRTSSRHANP